MISKSTRRQWMTGAVAAGSAALVAQTEGGIRTAFIGAGVRGRESDSGADGPVRRAHYGNL